MKGSAVQIEHVFTACAKAFQVDEQRLRKQRRAGNPARARYATAFILRKLGYSRGEVSRVLGCSHPQTAWRCTQMARVIAKQDPQFRTALIEAGRMAEEMSANS